MILDEEYKRTKGRKVIEILVTDREGKVKLWMPAMGTALKIVDKNLDINDVLEIRVRDLGKEQKK